MPSTTTTVLLAALAVYVGICSALRFHFERAMRKKFNYPDRESLSRMTNDDAQSILEYIVTREFPYLYKLALQFAIFKVRCQAEGENWREDWQFSLNPPTSPRCLKAIARMNYLHSTYKAAGRISNADFLYTLAVCIMEPIRFMRLYEWRPLNDMEACAIGTFWKSIGDAMQIEYKGYLSRAETGWRDGLDFAEDITAWAKGYEVECMKPAVSNTKPAEQLVELLLFHYPAVMKPFLLEVLTVLMGDRVREAFLWVWFIMWTWRWELADAVNRYPEPGIVAALVAFLGLNARRLVLRFLLPPRFKNFEYFSEPDPTTGRIYHWDYLVHPWYYKPTLWSQWGPMGLMTRLVGGTLPGAHGDMAKGFLTEDIGPWNRMGRGALEMGADEERLRKERVSACPFATRV
ncbi:uncharacterized protein E0L32_002078 [Thyridium curvatum]|uniref:ER-bound oxygenase mpaB/mpaB'/Rubber oxygenase catalytic domain-containing protein n=1 Tax=Thyridium curvatum TaxID=1093900 RepID=A0A507AE47_9PEZI|nr:uncharacterized protein E0L32_002055 [Thyridium curvatum]XP_030989186.1 uncharacterized protein E0L32_002078 [Thyridium curvatum]TPX07452.1 hypothetical protein E0L32_002055 [Thyridium curvatum]TPX07475.1 hypothetical protein E0L32_002078 [Thyridium curvatum]